MPSPSNDYFGFEYLNKLVDAQLHKKEDIIILFAHWFFIKNGFKCIGLGDSKILEKNKEGSEFLPVEWSDKDHYALRYTKQEKLYILLGRKSDNNLLLNLLRVNDNCVSNVKFPIETTVNSIHGSLTELIPTYQDVMNKMQKDLVEPVYTGSAKDTSTQTTSQTRPRQSEQMYPPHDPLMVGPPRQSRQPWNPEVDPLGVGRSDLDPLGGVGPRAGGMIFDPFTPAGRLPIDPHRPGGLGGPILPPGAIPPGARFDPFGPPDINRQPPRRRNPDHDHLPPPGYDDMFM